jgi:hypothetical protein
LAPADKPAPAALHDDQRMRQLTALDTLFLAAENNHTQGGM